MVYGLVDELDRLRAAAEALRTTLDPSVDRVAIRRGRELGLWE
jgi:hypothetical protein